PESEHGRYRTLPSRQGRARRAGQGCGRYCSRTLASSTTARIRGFLLLEVVLHLSREGRRLGRGGAQARVGEKRRRRGDTLDECVAVVENGPALRKLAVDVEGMGEQPWVGIPEPVPVGSHGLGKFLAADPAVSFLAVRSLLDAGGDGVVYLLDAGGPL